MPGISLTLPHWLYWLGLALFPLVAMALARRRTPRSTGYALSTAYFIWLVGGFLGLHRLYLKNFWGLLLWPLFLLILYCSAMERGVRVELSDARAELELSASSVARSEKRISQAQLKIEQAESQLSEIDVEAEASYAQRLQSRIEKERGRIADARARIDELQAATLVARASLEQAELSFERWSSFASYLFYLVVAWLLFDCLALPRLKRRAEAKLAARGDANVHKGDEPEDDRKHVGTGVAGYLDRCSLYLGEYVAFWSVLAVFVYYYEVVVRYVFNSPTNWAHESMFLMFGMQYLIAGSYAMLTGNHVRVDIFYARLSSRGKAMVDLLTSVFFFIFAGTLLVTSLIFAGDAMPGSDWSRWEVSFTEWAIQYWPVKIAIAVGAALLILQGISQVLRNLALVFSPQVQAS